jgi:hypothetical protein
MKQATITTSRPIAASLLRGAAIVLLAFSPVSAGEFIISYWCGPPAEKGDYDAQYAEVAECNFTHACFPCTGASIEQNKAILDACQKLGLKFIPSDGRLLEKQPSDPMFAANLDAVIADYAKHPALGGYFLTDEPGPGAFPLLGAVNQYLLKKDPQRLPFINMLPTYVPPGYLGISYEEYIDRYCRDVKPRLLCYDFYALFEGVERDGYFANMELMRTSGLKYDIPLGFIFQTTPHGTYRDPSETDLRWQVNTALAYGAKALFYFTYFTPTDKEANFHNGILDPSGKRTPHYDMAKRINGELKKLAPVLARLTSTAVYHTAPVPGGGTPLPADAAIQAEGPAQLVLGFFKHEDGLPWAIVVNRDLRQQAAPTLTFQSQVKQVEELSLQTGALSPLKVNDHKAAVPLPPSGIKILKLGR